MDSRSDKEKNEIFGAYMAYSQALESAGAFVGGEPLEPTKAGIRIRQDSVQDGPFADGKEQLGGYYLIEAKNLDEALDWAAKCPVRKPRPC